MLECLPGFLPRPAQRLGNYRQERRTIRLFGSNHGQTSGLSYRYDLFRLRLRWTTQPQG